MLRLHQSSLVTSLPSLGLNILLALLCISSFTTASPVHPSKDVLLVERAPIPGTVNSRPGQPGFPGEVPQAGSPATPPGMSVEMAQGVGPIPVCEGQAPTDRSMYPTGPLADRYMGGTLEHVCRERDPGPNCMCILNPRNLQVDLQCVMVGHFFPTLDRDWHTSPILQMCKTKCKCPHIPAEQIPPGSPRSPLGTRPQSMGQRPGRGSTDTGRGSQDLDSIV